MKFDCTFKTVILNKFMDITLVSKLKKRPEEGMNLRQEFEVLLKKHKFTLTLMNISCNRVHVYWINVPSIQKITATTT